MKINLVCSLFALILITLCGDFAYSQTFVGYVAEISGNWQVNGRGPLRQGQRLPASATIRTATNGAENSIKVADLNGKIRTYKKCSQPCSFNLPEAPARTSYFGAIFSTIMDLVWSSSSESYSRHRSKGRNFPDGIVKLENEKIYLTQPTGIPKIFL